MPSPPEPNRSGETFHAVVATGERIVSLLGATLGAIGWQPAGAAYFLLSCAYVATILLCSAEEVVIRHLAANRDESHSE